MVKGESQHVDCHAMSTFGIHVIRESLEQDQELLEQTQESLEAVGGDYRGVQWGKGALGRTRGYIESPAGIGYCVA